MKLQAADSLAQLREARHEERIKQFELMLKQNREEVDLQIKATEEVVRETKLHHERDINRLRTENRVFRQRVEALLIAHSIAIPDWWPFAYEDGES